MSAALPPAAGAVHGVVCAQGCSAQACWCGYLTASMHGRWFIGCCTHPPLQALGVVCVEHEQLDVQSAELLLASHMDLILQVGTSADAGINLSSLPAAAACEPAA